MYKVLVATDLTEEGLQMLRAAQDVSVVTAAPKPEAVRSKLADSHVLIARDDLQIDAELIERAPQLKIIARVATSIDGIDIDSATSRGIMVMNTPGVSATAAGEHSIALMLALSRRLIAAHNSLKEGWWLLDRKQQAGTQLHGKTLGLIGFGRVGRIVALRCLSFGMTVLAYDPYVSEEQAAAERVLLVGLKELLARSDFVSVHVPSTRETELLLDERHIRMMKPGARLINTAHGHVLDEAALAQALKDGHLAGAALDVYAEEPPYNSPLVGLDQVIHTPHIGDNTVEAMQDQSIQVVQQVLDALRDRDYRNVLNMPLLPGEDFEHLRPYMQLAEYIGRLHHALARHPVRRVGLEVTGEGMGGLVKPLMVGALKGLLMPVLGSSVSYINAPILAAERGWQITQMKGLKTDEYSSLVKCQVTLEDGEEIMIAGTLLDRKEPHILQINNYRMNFVPRGELLIMGSYDKPGVIGRIGTVMAENNINIASWHTGRSEPGGHTLTVVTLDQAIPDDVMEKLQQLDFVRHARQIKI